VAGIDIAGRLSSDDWLLSKLAEGGQATVSAATIG